MQSELEASEVDNDDALALYESKKVQVYRASQIAGVCWKVTNLCVLGTVLTFLGLLLLFVVYREQAIAYEGTYQVWSKFLLEHPLAIILYGGAVLIVTSVLNVYANNILTAVSLYLTGHFSLCDWAFRQIPADITDPNERSMLLGEVLGPRLVRIAKEYRKSNNYLQALLKEEFPAGIPIDREMFKSLPDPSSGYLSLTSLIMLGATLYLASKLVSQLIPITSVLNNLPPAG